MGRSLVSNCVFSLIAGIKLKILVVVLSENQHHLEIGLPQTGVLGLLVQVVLKLRKDGITYMFLWRALGLTEL